MTQLGTIQKVKRFSEMESHVKGGGVGGGGVKARFNTFWVTLASFIHIWS